MEFAHYEQRWMAHPGALALALSVLTLLATAAWLIHRYRGRSTVLHYEEQVPEILLSLGLSGMPAPDAASPVEQPQS